MKTVSEFFSTFPVIEVGDNVILREFTVKDAKDYLDLYSIKDINKFVPDGMIPKNLADAKSEITAIIDAFRNKQSVYWAISDKKTNKLMGGCGFHDWNRFNARLEIAYDLHPKYWRNGIVFACVSEVVKFAFLEMGGARVQATTVKENDASNNLLLKFGFKYEGLLRKYKFFKGKMTDIMMFSYTSDDFKRDVKLGKNFSKKE